MRLAFLLTVAFLCIAGGWYYYATSSKKTYTAVAYTVLPGWESLQIEGYLEQFKQNCSQLGGSERLWPDTLGSRSDWLAACNTLLLAPTENLKPVFEQLFQPIRFEKPAFMTGYYTPVLKACREKTVECAVPLHGKPQDLITIDLQTFDEMLPERRLIGRVEQNKVIPYFTRRELAQNAENMPVVAWLKTPLDAFFLHIQGSGILEYADGTRQRVGFAASNGHSYVALGREVLRAGAMEKENMNMFTLKQWLAAQVNVETWLHKNPRYIFFARQNSSENATRGALGVPLTPMQSVAVDSRYMPLGVPLFLDIPLTAENVSLQTLVFSEDVGYAIKGETRLDLYTGSGDVAEKLAAYQQSSGVLYAFIPRVTQ